MQVQTSPSDLPPGTVVGGYEISHKIGQGGMGQVYAATHPVIGKRVAIKLLAQHCVQAPDLVRRFIEEARAVNKIGHPNIIDIFAFGELADGRHYMVMEYLEGETLAERLHRETIPVAELQPMLRQICEALEAAHQAGIVHRDLKPANIWITHKLHGEVTIKLLDFGIAKLLGASKRITQTGVTVGTPHFMPPEQCLGRPVDHRADIYSFGVILYFVFTGVMPFRGTNMADIVYRHTTTPPEPPSRHRPLPPGLENLILDCLEKDPARRPQSALLLAESLEQVLTGSGPASMVAARVNAAPTRVMQPRGAGFTPNARARATLPAQLPDPAAPTPTPAPPARASNPVRLALALGGLAAIGAALWFGRELPPSALELDRAGAVTAARVSELVAAYARAFEPKATEAARVPQLASALDVAEDDAATFQDLFATEEWWQPYVTAPLVSALATQQKVLATLGLPGAELGKSEVVIRARATGVASGVVVGRQRAFTVAGALVTGFSRRPPDGPVVVIGVPFPEAAKFALGRNAAAAIGLLQGDTLIESAGEGAPRITLANMAAARTLPEGRGMLLDRGYAGIASPYAEGLRLLAVYPAPPPRRDMKTSLPLGLAGAVLLLGTLFTLLPVRKPAGSELPTTRSHA